MGFILIWTQRDGTAQSVSVRLNNMNKKVEDKVYFVHRGSIGGMAADFFIKGISPINSEEDAEKIEFIDYYMPDCEYVKEFLKGHPDYVYVCSTDNMHRNGWGMSFEGYKKIDAPLDNDNKED